MRSGRMLWIGKEKVFTRFDYGSAEQSCRELDLHGLFGDVLGKNLETPPVFYYYFCLVINLKWPGFLWMGLQNIW